MNIILNVSGQNYEVPKDTLMKIPYFHDMFDVCGDNINEVIPVSRPPHIFKHVLSFTIDPLYPFPAKYAFELDFYGIVYEQKKLYDKHQELLDKINDMNNNFNNQFDKIQTDIENSRGPRGPAGPVGMPGPRGPRGSLGCPGPTGSLECPGPTGSQGAQA